MKRKPVPVEDTFDDEPTTVKLVDVADFAEAGGPPGTIEFVTPSPSRTPQQRTQDDILDSAVVAVVTAQEAADEALDWMEVIVTLPKELRHNLPALLTDLGTLINEERRLRQ